jgi:flagella basal body P-ring formation protein FlgA
MDDPALRRQWFWIKPCGASPQPAQLLWAPLSLEKATPLAKPASEKEDHLLVHIGDDVVVTQTEASFSMRLAGHALGSGELGSKIQVEIHAWHSTTILAGKISGKDEVRVGD